MYKREYILNGIKNKNNGKLVYFPNIFDNIETTIENVKYTIQKNNDSLKIILESQIINNRELDGIFLRLYSYINIVIGYYPELLCGLEFDVKNLAEKYKIGNKHINSDTCFITTITNDIFYESYKRFLEILCKISFQIDYYSIATSKIGDCYCQIAIVNILQCFDGIYNSLEITKGKRKYLTDSEQEKVKKIIQEFEVPNFLNDRKNKKLKERLSECISRIEEENYGTRLYNLFEYIEIKYDILHFYNNGKMNEEKIERFISKCKRTRNKFSHASNEIKDKEQFNGTESAFYLYKLILVFRLLIIDEIGLDKLINKELLKKLIINIDSWKCNLLINYYLNKEGENNE